MLRHLVRGVASKPGYFWLIKLFSVGLTFKKKIARELEVAFPERTLDRFKAINKGQPVSSVRKVVQIVYSSYYFDVNGYSHRSRRVFAEILSLVDECNVIVQPGYPWKFQNKRNCIELELQTDGLITYIYDSSHRSRVPSTLMIESRRYFRMLHNIYHGQPVILHVHSNYKNFFGGYLYACNSKSPLVYESRGFWFESQRIKLGKNFSTANYSFEKKLELFAARNCDALVVLSKQMKEWYCDNGVRREKIFVVPNWVPEYKFTANEELIHRGDRLLIRYAGALVEYEGIELLIEAVNILKMKNIECLLEVYGKGYFEEALVNIVKTLKLEEYVIFKGYVKISPAELWSECDVSVLPRLSNFVTDTVPSLKLVEMMAYSNRLIASDLPVVREYLGEAAKKITFQAGSSESLAEILGRVSQGMYGEAIRTELAKRVENEYSSRRVIEGYRQVYSYVGSPLKVK
jgi:glycosyltransferase involved in cell wall biosynthesis